MYLSTSDGVDGVDVDAQSQPPKAMTPPPTTSTTSSPPSSPCCSTLLVIDDNSNSNDSTVINADIPTKPPTPNVQTSPVQKPSSSPPLPTADASNDTPAQQRRRNSSIAKLLGGQPLNNQQYEDITQQILVDQSAQNVSIAGERKSDGEIPRSRSSITRKMLKDAEQNKNASAKARPPSPGFSKDFEYLIRRELDIEHAPSTLQRDGSKPSVFQGLRSIRNSPSQSPKPQSPTPPKLKRKRSLPKPTTPLPAGAIRSSNGAPFSIRDPFELDSSAPSLVPPARHSHAPHQNGLFHFDFAQHHSRHQNLPPPTTLPHPQQFSSPVNTSSSFNYQKPNSSLYARFKVDPSSFSAPYSYARFPRTTDLALATSMLPASVHTSSSPVSSHPSAAATTRKIKTIPNRPDMFEFAMQRSMSNTSHQSTGSTSSSSSSPGPSDYCAPLKKRLLQSYKNEQRPASSS